MNTIAITAFVGVCLIFMYMIWQLIKEFRTPPNDNGDNDTLK